ncbi:3-oxoadipate enol-lactonase [Mycobacterium sp. SMC-4]|uniref:3-oxoadipate enol-lactonase n=1 Tax=Mycobacterium sp. SMC-4 TaxID=2857059 RepID=UPI003D0215EC
MSDKSTAIPVHAIDSGRRDGPVVVLSNSLGSTHRMWDAQVAALEERFRVIRYDTRGHGNSPVPDGPYTIDDLADDLLALLDRFEVPRAHLIGLSLGGMTAMQLAAREPARVDRMALLCTATQLPPASAWRQRAATVRTEGTAAVAESVVARWFTTAYLQQHPDDKSRYEQMVAATPAEGYAACCEAIAELDLREALPNVKAPTLAIAGADDPATPVAKLAEIVDLIPDSRLRVIDHAAHLANAEQPVQITEALITHLEHS